MKNIWSEIVPSLKAQVQNSGLLSNVLSDLTFIDFKNEINFKNIKLGVPNTFFSKSIAEKDLKPLIREELCRVLNFSSVDVELEPIQVEIKEQLSLIPNVSELESAVVSPAINLRPKWFLNPKFQVDYFINGEHSNFAFQCVQFFLQKDVLSTRQLFLYGPSGVGKTHLLHSLGWEFKNRYHYNVKLFSAEEFINDYHLYLSKKQMPEFRGKYRLNTDVLLIDDIHSLAKTKGAQEELFNIFNYYEQAGKYIAFTSDKSPLELENFENRLLTRFQGGLSAEIVRPIFDTRLKILKFKQQLNGYHLSDDVLEYLARSIDSSVRSLEGALMKVGLFQSIKGAQISKKEIESLMPQLTKKIETLNHQTIIEETALEFRMKKEDLFSNSRKKMIVLARSKAMFLMRERLSFSYSEIGRIFGKDHSTVLNSIKKFQVS